MPQVGDTEFPYTRQGIAAAKAASRKTGQKIVSRKSRGYKTVAKAAIGAAAQNKLAPGSDGLGTDGSSDGVEGGNSPSAIPQPTPAASKGTKAKRRIKVKRK